MLVNRFLLSSVITALAASTTSQFICTLRTAIPTEIINYTDADRTTAKIYLDNLLPSATKKYTTQPLFKLQYTYFEDALKLNLKCKCLMLVFIGLFLHRMACSTLRRGPAKEWTMPVLGNFNVFEYHSYEQIEKYLDALASIFPDLLKLETGGNSYEGRAIRIARLSTNPNSNNPVIFVEAGIHAREWVAPATAIYLIYRLLTDPNTKEPGGSLDGVDWLIMFLSNPDGYEFTRLDPKNRLWRKTRCNNGHCYGVDGNRNYDYKWIRGQVGCDEETFAGNKPFSEPETRMIRNVMLGNQKVIKLYVSLHSYGQYLLYPWGYTADYLPVTWPELHSLAVKVSDSIVAAGGEPFKVMSAGQWYVAAGSSDDYAYAVCNIPYSYTMELTDGFRFTFPAKKLNEVLPQYYAGFVTFALVIREKFGGRRQQNIRRYLTKRLIMPCAYTHRVNTN